MDVAPASEKLFNIIVKVANACTLQCAYCYVRPHNERQTAGIMSLKVMEKALLDYMHLAGQCRASGPDNRIIKLTWHGGEPLLAGTQYFRELIAMQQTVVASSYRVVNAITTNGVLLNSEWSEILKANQFEVAVSLDGPEDVHNNYRCWKDGHGSFRDVMAGINLLKDAGIPFGVMSVVTPEAASCPERLLDFFISNGLKNLNFIPYTAQHDWLSPDLFATFSCRLFDHWFDLDNPSLYIRDFANIIARIFGRESNLCEYTNCFGNYLALDTNGDVYMCDLLIGNRDFLLGNISALSLDELINSPRYRELRSKARANHPTCSKCPFFLICTGGCMYRRQLSGSLPGKDIYCSTRRQLISHVLTRLEQIDLTEQAH